MAQIELFILAETHERNCSKKEEIPKKWFFWLKEKNYKSKIDGLKKLSTRAPLFYNSLHFKESSDLDYKISFNLSVHVAIFFCFVLNNPFMMLFHILRSVSSHEFE